MCISSYACISCFIFVSYLWFLLTLISSFDFYLHLSYFYLPFSCYYYCYCYCYYSNSSFSLLILSSIYFCMLFFLIYKLLKMDSFLFLFFSPLRSMPMFLAISVLVRSLLISITEDFGETIFLNTLICFFFCFVLLLLLLLS